MVEFLKYSLFIFFLPILLDITDDFIFNFFGKAFSNLAVHGSCGDVFEFFDLLLGRSDKFDAMFGHDLDGILIFFADLKF